MTARGHGQDPPGPAPGPGGGGMAQNPDLIMMHWAHVHMACGVRARALSTSIRRCSFVT